MRAALGIWRAALTAAVIAAAGGAAAQHGGGEPSGNVPLYDNLGGWQHKVTTRVPLAQRYFDQGLRLIYAFNHDEAIRSFRAAAEADPNCAMAHWGASLALGPNYNMPLDAERAAQALAELAKAQELAGGASPAEQRYISALGTRYTDDPQADRAQLDRAFADAMVALAREFPDDVDAQVLAAEALMNLRPWALWTRDGQPQPGTEDIVRLLESAAEKAPRHPGALHYLIHALEASPEPARATRAADTLVDVAPGAGHLVHMPSHIYIRTGRLNDAIEVNTRAIEAERAYFAERPDEGVYRLMYHPHNIQFRGYVEALLGRVTDSLATANELAASVTAEQVAAMPMIESFVTGRLTTLVRFGRWSEALASRPPADTAHYARGVHRYASGVAHRQLGDLEAARWNLRQLQKIRGQIAPDRPMMSHKARDVLAIAEYDLAARLAETAGEMHVAEGYFRQAVAAQDGLNYDEPPPWFRPQRQALAMFLVRQGRAAEAVPLFREGLQLFPDNGWDLFGLAQALRAAGQEAEAAEIERQFNKAWSSADVALNAEWY